MNVAKKQAAARVIVRVVILEINLRAADIYIETLAVRATVIEMGISRFVILNVNSSRVDGPYTRASVARSA